MSKTKRTKQKRAANIMMFQSVLTTLNFKRHSQYHWTLNLVNSAGDNVTIQVWPGSRRTQDIDGAIYRITVPGDIEDLIAFAESNGYFKAAVLQ